MVAACLVAALGAAGCGAGGSGSSGGPADLPAAAVTVGLGGASSGPIAVTDATVVPGPSGSPARAYLTIRNAAAAADTLTAVSSNVSTTARLEHGGSPDGGSTRAAVPVPAA
ncbi:MULTISPECIES: hypothetical protein [unclassified Frankia]|uniref:hypothetical protein n=1 Tax=unclassified Frankia TaxID=2632575 RepID=UPI002AD3D396|nr:MULTISPECIES: hypothetical protein [unclassified Frankia]